MCEALGLTATRARPLCQSRNGSFFEEPAIGEAQWEALLASASDAGSPVVVLASASESSPSGPSAALFKALWVLDAKRCVAVEGRTRLSPSLRAAALFPRPWSCDTVTLSFHA